jgi:uncharacterized linocin/CFP29 family protein
MNAVEKWTPDIWNKINGQPGQPTQPGIINTVMGNIRVLQNVFPTIVQGNDNPIPADIIDPKTGIPSAGLTKPVVTITKSFQLDTVHVQDLPNLTMLMNQVTVAAQSLALVEDTLFFQGEHGAKALPPEVSVPKASHLGAGLLGKSVEFNKPILVRKPDGKERYGTATYAAVTQGISVFAANLQGKAYALILDPATYADANLPLQDSSIITPASAIRAIVEGGFLMSPGLSPNTGLFVSLGGLTTTLYIGTGPIVDFIVQDRKEGGQYFFTATESIQFHNLDARSLIKFEFK